MSKTENKTNLAAEVAKKENEVATKKAMERTLKVLQRKGSQEKSVVSRNEIIGTSTGMDDIEKIEEK